MTTNNALNTVNALQSETLDQDELHTITGLSAPVQTNPMADQQPLGVCSDRCTATHRWPGLRQDEVSWS